MQYLFKLYYLLYSVAGEEAERREYEGGGGTGVSAMPDFKY
jgi:hypothetical protein